MGTLPEVPPDGLIYLQSTVSLEFNKQLSRTDYVSADVFLEHLLGLFTKANEHTRFLQVRQDLAQKFVAVQQGCQFNSSNDLMKNLLQLHNDNLHSSSVQLVKQVQDKPTVSGTGRKSRKSQPKRNVKHQVLIDSQSDNGEKTPESGGPTWRERSVSSEEADSTPPDANDVSVPFDLSMVKQEVVEVEDDQATESSSKGGNEEQQPLCLSLYKPKLAHDSHRLGTQGNVEKAQAITLQSIGKSRLKNREIGHNPKKQKPIFQMNWRSNSEPPGQYRERPWQEPESEDSRNGVAAYPGLMLPDDKMETEVDTDERGGYNYVLTSLTSEERSSNNSLPVSPMQVPVKYPKSIHYVLSSDDEEPQDLSYGSVLEEQPQNLTVSKPQKTTPHPGKVETIKYDRNANAVAVSPKVAQLEKPQFAQPPFSVPHNLIFNDHRSIKTELTSKSQSYSAPHQNTSASSQEVTKLPPGLIIAAPPPHLQLVNVIATSQPMATQVYVQPSVIASKPGFPGGPSPLFGAIVTSPDAQPQLMSKPALSTDSDNSTDPSSPGNRKKRKRMEDTTLFRDPPETSLPFNGPNKFRFYCDVCDTGFTRRYTFNRHKCKGRVEKHYCQLCDKAYLSKYKLKDHILVKHEGQTVSCPDCGKKFSSRSSMEMHKKQQHEGQFSIWCKICGKGFNHTGHYYGHMNKHTNTKPFWCQQCGKRFYGSSYLHNHKQVCRGNSDLNFACTMCDRKFKCELYLKKHMKTHENIPIIADPSVAKLSGAELSEAGVGLPSQEVLDTSIRAVNGELGTRATVLPNGPENSDSNSNSDKAVRKSKRSWKVSLRKSKRRRANKDESVDKEDNGKSKHGEDDSQVDDLQDDDLNEHFKESSDVLEAPEIEIDEDWLPEDELDDGPEYEHDDLQLSSATTSRSNRSHKSVYVYDCKYCKKHCRSQAALNMHIHKVHGVSTKNRLLCRHCFKQFVFQHELDLHIKFTCKKVKRSFECSVCKLKFQTKYELQDHPCSEGAERPYFCNVKSCKYVCKTMKGLREHCARHLQIKPYLCNTCGCAFSTKQDMDRHADKHKDTQDMVCQDCGKAYKSKHSLQKHISQHKNKDRFKCRLCPFVTAFQNNFKQHMLKHTGRKHQCNLCDKSLRSATSLSTHMEKIHSFNKIFTCQYCDFTTTVGKKYSGHMRKHRIEKEEEEYESDEEISPLNLSENTMVAQSLPLTCNTQTLQPGTAIPLLVHHSPTVIQSSNISINSDPCLRSPTLSSHIPVLTDTTLNESEEVEITGQAADALMSNIVASSYSDISITQDPNNTNLTFYVTDMPGADVNVTGQSTMSMASLMIPDTTPSMADTENW